MRHDAYRELFERSADAILIIEGETFVDCNEATVEMLRYGSRDELLQTHPSQLSPATQPDGRDSYEKANEMIAIAFERGSHRFEWDHLRADGDVFPVEVLLTAIEEKDRRTLHVVWRDITRRKELEAELRHAQKLEAIGKLTGGIAHDFNNLLVTVLGNAEMLEAHLEGQREAIELARGIGQAGQRAADLVRHLLAFGRKQLLMPTVVDLNELVRQADALVRGLVDASVAIEYQLTEQPLPIRVDRTQIEQVLLNLVANARDAMPDGGRLTIGTVIVARADDGEIGREVLPAGDYAALRVGDEGCGMEAAVVDRCFEPFFTTKQQGAGTGLGLATVYGIARQSGGAATIDSQLGCGTRVEVLLPVCREQVPQKRVVPPAAVSDLVGSETLLMAEDDPMVRTLVRDALARNGYRVLVAEDGAAAQDILRAHRDDIDLLLTDVIMPAVTGPDLVMWAREHGFDGPVMFMSGYTGDRLEQVQRGFAGIDLLAKPFTAHELLVRVRGVLDKAPAPDSASPDR